MNPFFTDARRALERVAADLLTTYEPDRGGGWAVATREQTGAAVHLIELPCPRASLILEGIGRFELDLAENPDPWLAVSTAYLRAGSEPDERFKVVRHESSVVASVIVQGEMRTIEGADSASTDIDRSGIDIRVLERMGTEARRWPELKLIHIPIADRVLLMDERGRSLSFDFFGPRLAQWSIDPVWSPDLEIDVLDQFEEVRRLIAAFGSAKWTMKEIAGRLGGRRILTELRPPGGSPIRVRTPAPPDCECREVQNYPWVEWIE